MAADPDEPLPQGNPPRTRSPPQARGTTETEARKTQKKSTIVQRFGKVLIIDFWISRKGFPQRGRVSTEETGIFNTEDTAAWPCRGFCFKSFLSRYLKPIWIQRGYANHGTPFEGSWPLSAWGRRRNRTRGRRGASSPGNSGEDAASHGERGEGVPARAFPSPQAPCDGARQAQSA